MKRPELRLVDIQKKIRPDRLAVFLRRAYFILGWLWQMLCMPFRITTSIVRFGVSVGEGFFRAIYKIIIGGIGLGMLAFFCFGLIRVVFYPLFH